MDQLKRTWLVPLTTSREKLDTLEDAWGLPRHAFDVRDPKNAILLEATLCSSFDAEWFLLPADLTLIMRLLGYDSRDGDINECYNGTTMFQYRIVTFPSMRDCSLFVRDAGHTSSGSSRPEDAKDSHRPSTEFPFIDLPVPYHYAMVNTGAKLRRVFPYGKVDSTIFDCPPTTRWNINDVELIYDSWTHGPSPALWPRWLGPDGVPCKWGNHESDDASDDSFSSTRAESNPADPADPSHTVDAGDEDDDSPWHMWIKTWIANVHDAVQAGSAVPDPEAADGGVDPEVADDDADLEVADDDADSEMEDDLSVDE
ncbi:uncharacterized protein BXZ73DRAFT_103166 [Epithele typhae]|uniref:uncharacterized protein n=1 Tax=Epithele typhae TaxID=378194 RepID=UPI00200886AF|nr:uncharacterized protein BXZ73DRAFT_103166 [Epithele typhae]KAH9925631.1 hypothetical protein BXZ73DRAFT_103166 [Epithele typhae]